MSKNKTLELQSELDNLWKRGTQLTSQNENDLGNYDGGLFHYTDAAGLLGILNDQTLWATEHSYLNDSVEYSYGLKIAEQIIQERINNANSELQQNSLNLLLEYNLIHNEQIFITSLSEEGDLLSQWQAYGARANGFSIEFDPKELFRSKRKYPYVMYFLKKVIYDPSVQAGIIQSEVDFCIDEIERLSSRFPNEAMDISQQIAAVTSRIIQEYAVRFKNPAFQEEKEWRFVYHKGSTDSEADERQPKFRIRNQEIVPYVELDISASAGKKIWYLPLKKIVIGSKQDFEKNKKSIQMHPNFIKMSKIELKKSSIPIQ